MIPVLFGIIAINFFIIQLTPAGPIQIIIDRLTQGGNSTALIQTLDTSGEQLDANPVSPTQQTRLDIAKRKGLPPEFVDYLVKQYGFDQPTWKRFLLLIKNYLTFDLGESYYRDRSVIDLVIDKLPVSVSLGLWSTLIIYLVSIPLGIAKALRYGTSFDVYSSAIILIGSAIPSFMFALLLIVFFAGGHYFSWFPLKGLVSPDFDTLSLGEKIIDYFHHLTLPLIAIVIGGFSGLAILTRNAFLDQINALYVSCARAKGASERRVLYGHVFRNAMLIVIAGFPSAFIGILFTSATLIEILFSLDGLGLLTYDAVINRDYPVFLGTLYIGTLIGLVLGLINDVLYHWIDPRIDFRAVRQ